VETVRDQIILQGQYDELKEKLCSEKAKFDELWNKYSELRTKREETNNIPAHWLQPSNPHWECQQMAEYNEAPLRIKTKAQGKSLANILLEMSRDMENLHTKWQMLQNRLLEPHAGSLESRTNSASTGERASLLKERVENSICSKEKSESGKHHDGQLAKVSEGFCTLQSKYEHIQFHGVRREESENSHLCNQEATNRRDPNIRQQRNPFSRRDASSSLMSAGAPRSTITRHIFLHSSCGIFSR